MDRIFLKLALPHFRHYQQRSLRRAPLSALCAPIFCIENCGRDPLEFVSRSLARKNPGGLRPKTSRILAHTPWANCLLLLVVWRQFVGCAGAGRAEEQHLPIRKRQVSPVGSARPVFRLVPFDHDLGTGQ